MKKCTCKPEFSLQVTCPCGHVMYTFKSEQEATSGWYSCKKCCINWACNKFEDGV